MRLLIFIAAAWLVARFVRAWLRKPAAPLRRPPRIGGTMVRCLQCGVHLPESEAVALGAKVFCSEKHRDAYAAARRGGSES